MEPTSATIYEATVSIHMPSFGCTYQTGTRFLVNDQTVTVGMHSAPRGNEIELLERRGYLKKLSEAEKALPEKILPPRTSQYQPRTKMPVEALDSQQTAISQRRSRPIPTRPDTTEPEPNLEPTTEPQPLATAANIETGRVSRGMPVVAAGSAEIKDRSSTVAPPLPSTPTPKKRKKHLSPETIQKLKQNIIKARAAQVERRAQAQTQAENPKLNEKNLVSGDTSTSTKKPPTPSIPKTLPIDNPKA